MSRPRINLPGPLDTGQIQRYRLAMDQDVPTNGAKQLRRYLVKKRFSIGEFCLENKLDRVQIGRLLRGHRGAGNKITVRLAYSIELATNGAVPVAAWDERMAGHGRR